MECILNLRHHLITDVIPIVMGYYETEVLVYVHADAVWRLTMNTWVHLTPFYTRSNSFHVCRNRIYDGIGYSHVGWMQSSEYVDVSAKRQFEFPLNSKQYDFTVMLSVHDDVYAIGAKYWTDAVQKSLKRSFKFCANRWWEIKPMLQLRRGHAGVVFRGCIYITGGLIGETSTSSGEYYDTTTNQWFKLPSMCECRYYHRMFVYQDRIYAVGGTDYGSSYEVYDHYSQTWTVHNFTFEGGILPYNECLLGIHKNRMYMLDAELNVQHNLDVEIPLDAHVLTIQGEYV